MADKQNSGRGQSSNAWLSEECKNLTFSVLLNPNFLPMEDQFQLNEAISLGICDVLTQYAGDIVSVKWPNDIYLGDSKICGILIENMVQGSRIRHSIVGIGLNVNQTSFPLSLNNVTSMKRFLHKDYDLETILSDLCASIEARYLQLRGGRAASLHSDYLRNMYRMGTWEEFRADGQPLRAKIQGVSPRGLLRVETATGFREFGNKEIEFIHTGE